MRFFCLVLSLYFFTGSIMPGGHWDELPGVFNLVEHYQEHQARTLEKPISFMEFLAMHYDAGSGHQHQEDHSKLPFNHICSGAIIAILSLHQFKLALRETIFEKVFFLPVSLPHNYISDLLQPPRY